MKNLISIISSPFQLISFGEYVYEKKIEDYDLHLLYYTKNELKQLKDIIEFYNLRTKSKFKGTKFIQYLRLYLLALKIKKCEELVLGNFFFDPHLFLQSKLVYKKITIVDDGIISNKIPQYIGSNDKILNESMFKRGMKKLLNINSPKKIKVFTFFNLKDNVGITFEKNNFYYINSLIQDFEIKNSIIIIGQPLVEKNQITRVEYRNILTQLIKKYSNYNLLYYCHRKESEKNIIELNRLKKLTVVKLNTSIEIHLVKNKVLPIKVIGFTSSALISLNKIFNSLDEKIKIESYKINLNSQLFNSLYDDLRLNNVKVFQLDKI